jgi:hypothetical protein
VFTVPFVYQLVYTLARLEGGIQLYKGIGPKESLVEAAHDLILDASILYLDEAPDIRLLIPNQSIPKREYVQESSPHVPS